MLPLDDMVKELGNVTIRYSAGTYHADSGRIFSCGEAEYSDSISGAVWNALRLKRECEARDREYAAQSSALRSY